MNCSHCNLPLVVRAACPGCSATELEAALRAAYASSSRTTAIYVQAYGRARAAREHAEQQLAMLTKRYDRLLAAAKFVVDSEGDRLSFPDAMATLRKKCERSRSG